jgi:hypothetical protein
MKNVFVLLMAATLGLSCATASAAGKVSSAPPAAVTAHNAPAKSGPDVRPVKKAPVQKAQAAREKKKKKNSPPFH